MVAVVWQWMEHIQICPPEISQRVNTTWLRFCIHFYFSFHLSMCFLIYISASYSCMCKCIVHFSINIVIIFDVYLNKMLIAVTHLTKHITNEFTKKINKQKTLILFYLYVKKCKNHSISKMLNFWGILHFIFICRWLFPLQFK